MHHPSALPYKGLSRKLVLAFDVGTTFSGISFCVLDPGNVPEVKRVLKFPDQEVTSWDVKVPSIIWYSSDGEIVAIGAGAVGENIVERSEDEGWHKVEWFKLKLRPNQGRQDDLELHGHHLPELPLGKSVVEVFGDYLNYLYYKCAKVYIEKSQLQGKALWESLVNTTEFVLSHPNGWGGEQQDKIRQAAILGGLIPDTEESKDRVHFVTEGEASLHFCISKELEKDLLNSGDSLMVVDAGGGTIDISTYDQLKLPGDMVSYKEVSIPQCHIRGSVLVSESLRIYLNNSLPTTSRFHEDIPHIIDEFDKATKLRFRDPTQKSFIRFGGRRDNLEEGPIIINKGLLKLEGPTVAKLFQGSINCIVEAIKSHGQESDPELHEQKSDSKLKVVFLVGGFAANEWLLREVEEDAAKVGVSVCRPDCGPSSKVVADGAVIYWIDRLVSSRKSRNYYGVQDRAGWTIKEFDHIKRIFKVTLEASGVYVRGRFFTILKKGTSVLQTEEFRSTFTKTYRNKPDEISQLEQQDIQILRYRGEGDPPEWVDHDENNFERACVVVVDTTVARKALVEQKNIFWMTYYQLEYDVILHFGNTEFKAQIAWKEDGVEKRSPAAVIYEQTEFDRLYQPYVHVNGESEAGLDRAVD